MLFSSTLTAKKDYRLMKYFIVLFSFILVQKTVYSQEFSITPHSTVQTDTLGSEMIFTVSVTNLTQGSLGIYLVRTLNQLPADWSSSLCFQLCFASWLDSVATTAEYQSTPLAVGETREVSVHVFPMNNPGQGIVTIKIGSLRTPANFATVSFTANAIVTSLDNEQELPQGFSLSQNYPNPFNPVTRINFSIPETENVTLRIYDIFGQEVLTALDNLLPAGVHSIEVQTNSLPSGNYYYTLTAGNYHITKKMTVLK